MRGPDTGLRTPGVSATGRDRRWSGTCWRRSSRRGPRRSGRAALDIVDVGAGTGGFAVSIASLGHRVTVVDPSPDALAAARWRAAEAGVTLTEVQGEAIDLPALVGEPGARPVPVPIGRGADLVICHNVLEYVDSPSAALAAIARVLRPGGTVSVLAANTVAAVLQRALAGKYAEARAMLPGPVSSSTARSPGRRHGAAERGAGRRGGAAVHPARADRADRRAPGCGPATRTASGSSPACCRARAPTWRPPRRCGSLRRPRPPARRCGTSPPGCTCSATGLIGPDRKNRDLIRPGHRAYLPGGRPPYPPMRACGPRASPGCRSLANAGLVRRGR